jgi:hypothetical protein
MRAPWPTGDVAPKTNKLLFAFNDIREVSVIGNSTAV